MIPCPACGTPMPPKRSYNRDRKACSGACGLVLGNRAMAKQDLYVEEVEHLSSFGSSPQAILDSLGVSAQALARGLTRAGRRDLARPFWRLRTKERGRQCVDCGTDCSYRSQRCHPCAIAVRDGRVAA